MVGAFNVGSIGLIYEPDFLTNQPGSEIQKNVREYAEGMEINVGDRLGTFYLGSTVVIVTESTFDFNKLTMHLGSKVRYGQMVQSV